MVEYFWIELEAVEIGGVFLADHAFGIVDLKQVSYLIAGVGGASMPDFTAKENDIARVAHDRFFDLAFP